MKIPLRSQPTQDVRATLLQRAVPVGISIIIAKRYNYQMQIFTGCFEMKNIPQTFLFHNI